MGREKLCENEMLQLKEEEYRCETPPPPKEEDDDDEEDAEILVLCRQTARLDVQKDWISLKDDDDSLSPLARQLPLLPGEDFPSRLSTTTSSSSSSEDDDCISQDLACSPINRAERTTSKSEPALPRGGLIAPCLSFWQDDDEDQEDRQTLLALRLSSRFAPMRRLAPAVLPTSSTFPKQHASTLRPLVSPDPTMRQPASLPCEEEVDDPALSRESKRCRRE